MNPILRLTSYIFLSVSVAFISCKKDNYVITTLPQSPLKATINFHIKDTNTLGWGEPIYLYRLVLTPTTNYYDSSENIYLRPNIDTSFKYEVAGNTNNSFSIGGDPFNGILIYMEQKLIAAGSNINWEIEY
jgi:hypothetical protein